jgi:hypothetical protein
MATCHMTQNKELRWMNRGLIALLAQGHMGIPYDQEPEVKGGRAQYVANFLGF